MAKGLVKLIPEHKIYVEPFVGGGAVFFQKEKSQQEVIADKDPEIVFAYTFLQNLTQEQYDELNNMDWVSTRARWKEINSKSVKPKNDVERMFNYLYDLRGSFSMSRRTYRPYVENESIKPKMDNYWNVKERLQGITILCDSYENVIKKYDGKDTFYFLDPPYPKEWPGPKEHNIVLEPFVECVRKIKGNFLITLNESPENRKMFEGFKFGNMDRLTFFNRVNQQKDQTTRRMDTELLIANYEIKDYNLYEQLSFDPAKWSVEKILKSTEKQLIKMHDNLFGIWEERGSRKNDEVVINTNAIMVSELNKRNVKYDINELDKIVKSDISENVINDRIDAVIKKANEVGPIVWIPDFICQTGSAMFAEDRKPGDIDWVVKLKEIPSALILKLNRVAQEIIGEQAHLINEPTGPNWRYAPIYDLVLMPRKEVKITDIDSDSFKSRFYQSIKINENGVNINDIDMCESVDAYYELLKKYDIDTDKVKLLIKHQESVPGKIEMTKELKELFKNNPTEYKKNYAIFEVHFRGMSAHIDFRRKINGYLEGDTIMNLPEGFINKEVTNIKDGKLWAGKLLKKGKFRPDMDPNDKVVLVVKEKQPLEWLNVRDMILEPGSVGATRFEPGVFILLDDGMAYPGVQKPYFKEFFLEMSHFKGRMVERLIPTKGFEKDAKEPVQWQTWFNMVDQQPYLLSQNGREKADYTPPDLESGISPEWEKKVKPEYTWWTKAMTPGQKLKLMDAAYNDLVERGEIDQKPIKESVVKYILKKRWWMGPIVVRGIPVISYYLLIDTGKDQLEQWQLNEYPDKSVGATRSQLKTESPEGKSWMEFQGPIAPSSGESEKWKYEKGVVTKIITDTSKLQVFIDSRDQSVETKETMIDIFKIGDEVYLDPRLNVYKNIDKRGPAYGNPNKALPVFDDIIDEGAVNIIDDNPELLSFNFKGNILKGNMVMKKESSGSDMYVFSKGELPENKGAEK